MRSNKFVVASGNAVSAYPWLHLDHHVENFAVSYQVVRFGAGTGTYSLQGTLNNVEDTAVSAHVFDIVSGAIGSINGNFTYPVAAVRLNMTAVSGVSTHALYLMQAGN